VLHNQKDISYKHPSKTAFSLMEVSMVVLIISVLIAGILLSRGLMSRFYLKTAETMTVSSPINGITNNALWLETSLSNSFRDDEESDGKNITLWQDQNASYINKTLVTAVGSGPEYSNSIHKIHAVKFVGSDANYLKIEDASFLNESDYTIFVLEKRESNADNNYFIGSQSSNANDALALGYSQDATVIHAQGSNAYSANVSAYANSFGKPRLFSFVHSSAFGNKTFINGVLAATDTNKEHLNGISSLEIGKNYTGEIGEIAIFTRLLKNEERTSIENYLASKWKRAVNRDAVTNGSCVGGTVTDSGCSMNCSTAAITGVSSPSSVGDGESGVSLTCGATGYDGTITASCTSGVLSTSGSCGCDTGSGYSSSGSSCVQQCAVSVTGVSDTTPVDNGSGTLTCDDTYYDGATIGYSCSGTTLTPASACNCETGRSGSDCSACDASAHYYLIGSSCESGCSIPTGSGTSKIAVEAGSVSTPCNSSGFSGNLVYTCSSAGSLNISTACVVECSATGAYTTGTDSVSGKTFYTFSGDGTITCPSAKIMEVLLVGGGGGGSADVGGGGGGGQVVETTITINGTATISVGASGARGYNRVGNATGSGNTGGTSSIEMGSTLISALGGSGARGRSGGWNNSLPGTGYTGGGAGYPDETSSGSVGTGGATYKGGDSNTSGGGGDSNTGGAGQSRAAGAAGGVGVESLLTGVSIYYGGGGGGSGHGASAGLGGNGGGGNGTNNSINGANGVNGLGGGGGGAGSNGDASGGGGNGGSGVIIIK
jgi:hypothetical protein